MKKLLTITAAAATLLVAGAANAAMYIVTDTNGQQFVVSDDGVQAPLLIGAVEAPPANCQAGFYYQAGNNRVMSCGGGPGMTMAPVPPGTLMANGQPYPPGAMIVVSDADAANAGAVKDTGTTKRGEGGNTTDPLN